jgi:hypothetical protein
VISLSNIEKVEKGIVEEIRNRDWPFAVNLLTWRGAVSEGGNRNRAGLIAKGDIICHQCADDLPFPERIDVIKHFFRHYDIEFLVSSLYHGIKTPNDFDDIRWEVPGRSGYPYYFTT